MNDFPHSDDPDRIEGFMYETAEGAFVIQYSVNGAVDPERLGEFLAQHVKMYTEDIGKYQQGAVLFVFGPGTVGDEHAN